MAFWSIRTIKRLLAKQDEIWVNGYEAYTPTPSAADVVSIANTLITAEKQIHTDYVEFVGWEANLYLPSSDKFDPSLAPDGTSSGVGARLSAGNELYDLEMCYQYKLKTLSRAYGKKGYRGCLLEADTTTIVTGKAQLAAGSTLQPGGSAMIGYLSALADLLGAGADEPSLVCYTRFQTSPRGQLPKVYGPYNGYQVTGVQYKKLGNIDMTHAWHNRSN